MEKSCDITVLNERVKNDISPTTLAVIETVTAHMDTLPVGTFKYRIFKYPGDVDLFEELEECCTLNQAKIKNMQTIQTIIEKILKSNIIIFTDFKAGYDQRFKIYTGVINGTIDDYDPKLIRRDITNLYNANLLTQAEYIYLVSLVIDIPTNNSVITLNEELRKYWVIHWTAQEILQGFKILRGNYTLYLDVALTQGSIVKLDTIVRDDRYIEVTNFFLIKQKDKFGNYHVLSAELGDYELSMLADVYKYYDRNPLKSVKRLWMYLSYKQRVCDLTIFTKLFSSEIALFSQIVADIEVAINLLESNLVYDQEFLYTSITERLKLLHGTCIPEKFASSDPVIVHDYLVQLKSCLSQTINIRTNQWLADNHIDIMELAKV